MRFASLPNRVARLRPAGIAVLALVLAMGGAPSPGFAQRVTRAPETPRILVFSKTAGYRHASIETGAAAITRLGAEHGFAVDLTEDAAAFTDRNLKRYRAVVFLSTTGDVLNPTQEHAFERYIQAGGGYVGIHSATDTEYGWPWYGKLAGAYFDGHPGNPNVRKGTFRVRDGGHASTQGLPARWEREDEFYSFKSINPAIHVLVDIDETSYEGGTNGANHPMSWYHDFDGGRAWYTNMGHTEATFAEPLFLRHLLGGIRHAMGSGAMDYRRARPEENRFTRVVLGEKLNEPTEMAVLPDERVLFIERKGAIQLYTPSTGTIKQVGFIPVNLTYLDGGQAEDGLLGLAIDPAFAANGWLYLFYSKAGAEPKNVLARYTMRGDSVDTSNAIVMLEVVVQREQCCHTGGSIAFDAKGNLFLSTGDNSNPFMNGYAPIDERPGRMPWDAQKSSANTNDLRGKILRIHPEPDGSYTIPEGNLFPPGMAKTRPEIYTMGHRNPYRIAVDKHTGVLYWGDVGPDASVDSVDRGPAGYDEVGRATRAGNYGWPHFVGDNKAYRDVDYATMHIGPPFDPQRPHNDSPNNTGLTELPPAQKAFIWYPYGPSGDFPLVGAGGRTAMAGPVFYGQDFARAARRFPAWYEGKLFTYDWMRGWIMAVTMDSSGNFASMERFLPSAKFANPVDMEFGPNGDLYVMEYGTTWFKGNDDARLVRIEFNAGNRAPVAVARANKTIGATPMRVALDASATTDADDDELTYAWTITGAGGRVVRRLTGERPSLTLPVPGTYSATLTVRDTRGATSTSQLYLTAGNEPPAVAIDVAGDNTTFYWPHTPVHYAVRVTDREDGSLKSGRIAARRVRVSAQYLAEAPAMGGGAGAVPNADGLALIEGSDCLGCHKVDQVSIGPAYAAVAAKYARDSTALPRLAAKIRAGGTGVWGKVMMPAHAQLSDRDARLMARYILGLGQREPSEATPLPARGRYLPPDSASGTSGAIVLRAAYTDNGANGRLGVTTETSLLLRAPTLSLAEGELSEGAAVREVADIPGDLVAASRSGAHARIRGIDLTAVGSLLITGVALAPENAVGGTIEVRLDSPTGTLLGTTEALRPKGDKRLDTLRLPVPPTPGVHDVYLIFRNAQAASGQLLFFLSTLHLER
ncbi:MAG: ThuA domain-containing protein [Gemmatimonadetes bacterium]|nr:ThuA domain-containing protein [Gemmatimonadota bacterium]